MDTLGFLDGPEGPVEDVQVVETEAAPAEVVEATAEPAQEAQDGPVRDEQGRFAPKPAEALVEASQPTQVPPGYVPINALHEARRRIHQLESAQTQPVTDIFEDQQGFIDQQVMQPITQQITDLNLNWSRRFAEQTFGAETVKTAEQWVLEQNAIDPTMGQRVMSSSDPYGAAVQEFKRGQILNKLDDPARIDAFLAWESAQQQVQASPPPAAEAATPTPMPTRSLASAPSAGGAAHVPTGPGQAFDSFFRN